MADMPVRHSFREAPCVVTGIEWPGSPVRLRGVVGARPGFAPAMRLHPGRFFPSGGGLAGGFMIVGQRWRYSPQMTHDHGRRRFLRAAGVPGTRTREPWPASLRAGIAGQVSERVTDHGAGAPGRGLRAGRGGGRRPGMDTCRGIQPAGFHDHERLSLRAGDKSSPGTRPSRS